eukprot:GHVU01091724.1.p3 GENE.GHVU01091724.1~~GHVU01091724.1.p3  ORF type:complete len:116 (-),score=2.42 GHVU01091724.1:354-701(-)
MAMGKDGSRRGPMNELRNDRVVGRGESGGQFGEERIWGRKRTRGSPAPPEFVSLQFEMTATGRTYTNIFHHLKLFEQRAYACTSGIYMAFTHSVTQLLIRPPSCTSTIPHTEPRA